MYQRFYGLRELPFELTVDPKFLFLTPRQREALSNLQYGLSAGKALTVLTGEPGTGKTTLLRAALASDRCRGIRCVFVNNPALTRAEFVEALALAFELDRSVASSKTGVLQRIERVLRDRRARGEITALVVDEAQCLSTELLEEIRLLGNIETPTEKLLPLVLAGQPELRDRLEDPALRQLRQRIALRCETWPFELHETAAYIASRIETAGGAPAALFTQEAVAAIHRASRGIARTISVLCDNALVTGMALDRRTIDRAIVLEVCRDFAVTAGDPDPFDPDPPDDSDTARQEASPELPPAPEPSVVPIARPKADLTRGRELFVMTARPRRFSLLGF
jgi:type II secretory pathway predicted ATPase ExeA